MGDQPNNVYEIPSARDAKGEAVEDLWDAIMAEASYGHADYKTIHNRAVAETSALRALGTAAKREDGTPDLAAFAYTASKYAHNAALDAACTLTIVTLMQERVNHLQRTVYWVLLAVAACGAVEVYWHLL